MVATVSQPAETRARGRWFRSDRRTLIVIAFLSALAGTSLALSTRYLPLSWTADYDRVSYYRIGRAIAADPTHLRGKPFDRVRRELGLDEVPWDDGGALQLLDGVYRIYHFRGFALHVTMQLLPAGATPDRIERPSGTGEDLRGPSVLWLHDSPLLRIDGISDRGERMKRHFKELDEMCASMNAEADRRRRMQQNENDNN
jgi:hypothetical protein